MHIIEKFQPDMPLLSIEIFPPKTEEGILNLKKKLLGYKAYSPDFISVTYGAGGSTGRSTLDLVTYIQNDLSITSMAHLTCVGHSREELKKIFDHLEKKGIKNILALRGDPPKGEKSFKSVPNGFRYSHEIIEMLSRGYKFSIGCAAYPEGHIEAKSFEDDLNYLKKKVESGASFLITQFFLDNAYFFRFKDLIEKKGIKTRLIAGILPISNYSQLTRFSLMCGVTIPARVMKGLNGKTDEDQEKFGFEHAARQIDELLQSGVDGIHLYALNKKSTVEILAPVVREKFPIK